MHGLASVQALQVAEHTILSWRLEAEAHASTFWSGRSLTGCMLEALQSVPEREDELIYLGLSPRTSFGANIQKPGHPKVSRGRGSRAKSATEDGMNADDTEYASFCCPYMITYRLLLVRYLIGILL
jgi:hypothetical protein